MLAHIGYNVLQVLFVVGLAPLFEGVLARLKEIVEHPYRLLV